MRRYFFLFLAAALLAQAPRLPEPYQSIVELAHSAPPEFASDALLRVLESGKIPDRTTRLDLAEQAFQLAGSAKFPVRMHGVSGTMRDTRSGNLSQAYDLKLDALSLESRAVRDLLSLDAAKARELFQNIPRPTLTSLSCDDALVYDVSDFYQTLGAVANAAFTQKERDKEEHVNFLLDYLGQATSPVQLAPLVLVIKAANITPAQRDILWNRFNGLLEGVQADERSFSASLADLSQIVTPEMQASFDKYRQKTTVCKDDVGSSVLINGPAEPPKTGSTPKIERYWQSSEAQRLLQDANKLRFGPDGKPLSDAERSTPEWQQQLADFLSELADWTPTQEKSEADFYHQKCVVFAALMELIPPGEQRDKMLQAYVDFISNSNLQQQSPVEWFMQAHLMLERVRSTNTGEPAKLLDSFQASGNAVLALYSQIERTFGSKLPPWVTLSK
ncbi:MAG TPA: hypothetical protein VNX70_05170 [Bryobacteraceae bacterium]|jgi:hypothetical protein|nr:hypothetical protein [Bryobacteraceae bacterium]